MRWSRTQELIIRSPFGTFLSIFIITEDGRISCRVPKLKQRAIIFHELSEPFPGRLGKPYF